MGYQNSLLINDVHFVSSWRLSSGHFYSRVRTRKSIVHGCIGFRRDIQKHRESGPALFFNDVIEEVLKKAEGEKKRMSLTRRVSEAAQIPKVSYRNRERVYSADDSRTSQINNIIDSKRRATDAKPHDSVQRMESVRHSRPWIDIDTKDNDNISLPPPESEFALKLRDFVKENEQTMEKVIEYLIQDVDEKEMETYATI